MAGAALFGMTLAELFSGLLTEPWLVLKTLLTFWWLRIWGLKKRLDLYDPCKRETTKRGITILPVEQQLEAPQEPLADKATDSVLIFGGNSSGDRLVTRVCRETGGHVSWLYLRLSDGRSYQPAYPEKSFPPGEDFVAGGLRIKCQLAMRKWRVSFNGLLREVKGEKEQGRTVHVKFSFMCLSTSRPLDVASELPPSLMAAYLAKENNFWPKRPKSISKGLDRYVQAVNLLGTLSVDTSDELQVYLWGAKHRSRDMQPYGKGYATNLFEIIGHTKDGQLVYAGEVIPPGFKSKLCFGHYLERTSLAWPVTDCKLNFASKQPTFSGVKVALKTERSDLLAEMSPPTHSLDWNSGVSLGHTTRGHLSPIRTQDGDTGYSLAMEHHWTESVEKIAQPAWQLSLADRRVSESRLLLLPLAEAICQSPALTGGKGASLAALTQLATTYKTRYVVPDGFVVTTTAYQEFIKKTGIETTINQFQQKAWCTEHEKLNKTCVELVKQISQVKLPGSVEEVIRKQVEKQFPATSPPRRFAVRSSASGEDSEDMSAAGQMTTLLGVIGADNICQAVVKCWASQFSFTAIQYKRQNGQELNSPMAVVVQEMVAADVAGVLFTCDPVTGNPQNVTITANYGIGESVVSASAEPDTVVLFRDDRNQLTLQEVRVGRKTLKIVMADGGDVVEEHNDEQSQDVCCISEENALQLAQVSLKIEEAYGFPVDVEWAFRNNNLFMLQARPVTTFDRETRLEVLRSVDAGLRAEDEYTTRANAGEVLPGACSHLGLTFFCPYIQVMMQNLLLHRNPYSFPFHPFNDILHTSHNRTFLSIPNFILRFYKKDKQSFLAEAGIIAAFGRLIEDQAMFEQADKRNRMYPTTFVPYQLLFFIKDLFFAPPKVDKARDRLDREEMDCSKCANSEEMFHYIWKRSLDLIYGSECHIENTFNSSIYNNLLMSILCSANKGWTADVFSDFATVLSACGNVESADIPFSLQQLGKEIGKHFEPEKFKNMDTKEALDWLENEKSLAGKLYKDFIRKHGHRCAMEFDIYTKPWRMDRLPLVKTLQESAHIVAEDEKAALTTDQVLKKLKSPLSWLNKALLRVLIPLCRRAVVYREKGKSTWIKQMDLTRQGYWALAAQMLREGRLPDRELIFFLSTHELLQLIQTRNPSLVQKAVRRRAIFPELNKLRFPEISKGVPQATNTEKKNYDDLATDLEIKGTPVSQGVVKGLARVALDIQEAASIQPGEILIAYGTDIAWSPYFPLLGGVATELGGLISHGAVVAREYGLPCVVGVFDATIRFKTGDLILLDGNKGLLKRIASSENP